METDVRLTVTNADSKRAMFVGLAPTAAVENFLAGVAHDRSIAYSAEQAGQLQHVTKTERKGDDGNNFQSNRG